MILKLQTGIGKWNYFEGEKISIEKFVPYEKILNEHRKFGVDPVDGSCFSNGEKIESCLRGVLSNKQVDHLEYIDKLEVTLITIVTENKTIKVATDFPGYLMNNDGKTIDRIN